MNKNDLDLLAERWLHFKNAEKEATEARREVEDEIGKLMHLDQQDEGTLNFEAGDYKIKITSKTRKNVDADKLQEIAAEHGLLDKLTTLFRWKAEINAAVWKVEKDEVKDLLLDAVTTTPSRATFTITQGE